MGTSWAFLQLLRHEKVGFGGYARHGNLQRYLIQGPFCMGACERCGTIENGKKIGCGVKIKSSVLVLRIIKNTLQSIYYLIIWPTNGASTFALKA